MKIPENTQMDADYWRDVERAMRRTPQERVRIGIELFERAVYLMTQGLRSQFPQASEEELRAIRRERLARIHELESRHAETRGNRSAGAQVIE